MKKIELIQLIPSSWHEFFDDYFKNFNWKNLENFLNKEYEVNGFFPRIENIMRAFQYFQPNETKVVICGQDPYHQANQADGLAFSCSLNKKPPSLKNILFELNDNYSKEKEMINYTGNLDGWAKQGVLLINQVLTVQKNKPFSHKNRGWEEFTQFTISRLSNELRHICFILWGNQAIRNKAFINGSKNLILESVHPSPLSAYRGFFGNQHFLQSNDWFKEKKIEEVKWWELETVLDNPSTGIDCEDGEKQKK